MRSPFPAVTHPPARGGLARAVVAVVVAAGALGAALPGGSAAATGADRDRYRAESAHDTSTPKAVTAGCPAGEIAFGGGGRVVDGNGSVLLTSVVPDGDSVTVTAGALPEYETAWSVVAVVVCYPPQPAAVAARSAAAPATSTQSVVAHASVATCPSGTELSGTGFALAGGPGQQLLTGLVPDTGARTVSVSVVNTASGLAKPTAYAVCVPPFGDPYYALRVEGSSANDTTVPKVASASGAPGGVDDWAVLSGAGGLIVNGPSDAFLDTVVPDPGLLSATARANRLPGGATGSAWLVTAYGTDAYYY